MKLLLQLLGEHPELPLAEIKGVLEGEGISYRVMGELEKERLLLLDVNTTTLSFLSRLSLTKKATNFIAKEKSLEKLADKIGKNLPTRATSFAIRASHSLEKKLGADLVKKSKLKVNLENPDITILCFPTNKTYYAGFLLPLARTFEARKPQFRPYFSPTSMHPKLARTLVNLARVKKGDLILDPFCGTGGILIEAGLMGTRVMGVDWDKRAVEGCKKNLHFYNLKGKITQGDALNLKLRKKVDAIVTDLPYGHSSLLSYKNLREMYRDFLLSAENNLKAGGYLVAVLPAKYDLPIPRTLSLTESHKIYVHKSLSRKILVLKKKK